MSKKAAATDPLDGIPDLYGENGRLDDLARMVAHIQRQRFLLAEEQRQDKVPDDATWVNPATQKPLVVDGKPMTYRGRREALEEALRDIARRHPKDMETLRERAGGNGSG